VDTREHIRFVAEDTLGKLAKWLRMLGFDTVYEREPSAKQVQGGGRIRLTRTREVFQKDRSGRVLFIHSDRYMEQIRQVIEELDLNPDDIQPFTRCNRCNALIQLTDKNAVFGQVPDYIWETNETFRQCINCNRIYWPGSHTKQSMDRIRSLFGK